MIYFAKAHMKTFSSLSLALTLLLAGCATTPPDTAIHALAVQTFGTDTHLKLHEVMYSGPFSSAISSMGTSDDLALASDLQPGATQDLDLVVWSDSSPKAAATLFRALRYPGVQSLPHLRLLLIGNPVDAEHVRPTLEATGAKFYFHQQ
jgi:hypothetical protein